MKTLPHPNLGHNPLTLIDAQRELHFVSDGTPVSLSWSRGPGERDYLGLLVVNRGVTNPAKGWIFSLYNLGIQGRCWKVRIVPGDGFKLLRSKGGGQFEELSVGTGGWYTVPATGRRKGGKKQPAEPDGVLFIQITAAVVVLRIESRRLRHGAFPVPLRGTAVDDHDTAPPPPDPGGEEGEGGEEEGDGEGGPKLQAGRTRSRRR